MKRFDVRLPDELYERLRKEAFESRLPMGIIIRKALRLWFGVQDKDEVGIEREGW